MKNIILPLLVLAFYAPGVLAQESVNSAGGNAVGSGGSASFSIGQVAYIYAGGSGGSVSQGVQHAYDISIVGEKENKDEIALNAFPNPTQDALNIEMKNYDGQKYTLQLLDAAGKLLRSMSVNSSLTTIQMQDFPSAPYFVNIINANNKSVKSFRIVKK